MDVSSQSLEQLLFRGVLAGIFVGALIGTIDVVWALIRLGEHAYSPTQLLTFWGLGFLVVLSASVIIGAVIGFGARILSRIPTPSWMTASRLEALLLSATAAIVLLALRNYYWRHWYEFGPFSIETPHLRQIALLSLAGAVFVGLFAFLTLKDVGRKFVWLLLGAGVVFVGGRAAYEASRMGPMNYVHAVTVIGVLAFATLGVFLTDRSRISAKIIRSSVAATGLVVVVLISAPAIGFLTQNDTRLFLYERTAFSYRILWMNPAFSAASRLQAPDDDGCERSTVSYDGSETSEYHDEEDDVSVDYVVLIVIDTLRRDRLHAERDDVELTKNLSSFADESYDFTRAYVPQPGTRVAFGAFLTGKAPGPPDYRIYEAQEETIVPELNEAGVFTGMVPSAKALYEYSDGFDVVDDAPYRESFDKHTSSLVTERASALAKEMAKEERGFLKVHYLDPHAPHRIPDDFNFGRKLEERYDAEVAHTDRAVGRLLDNLDEAIPEDRATFILSDHGEELWDHGYRFHASRLYEESVQLLALMNVSGHEEPGEISSVAHAGDVAATVADFFNISIPEGKPGISWRSDMGGEREIFLYSGDLERVGFVNEKYKFIVNRRPKIFELYNLKDDPMEQNNLADEKYEKVRESFCRLNNWEKTRQITGPEIIRDYE